MTVKRHSKTASKDVLDIQQHVYAQIHPNHRPSSISRPDDESLEYDFVDGDACFDIALILEGAKRGIWEHNSRRKKECDTDGYITYMFDVLNYHYGDLKDLGISPGRAFGIFERLSHCELTPVFSVHGDLTVQNTVQVRRLSDTYVVFIDPADDHCLRCQEIDEAKLLQSIDGWEMIARDWMNPILNAHMIRRSESNQILLLSHYIRMLRYQNGKCKQFAYKRIHELINELK